MGPTRELAPWCARARVDQAEHVSFLHRVTRSLDPADDATTGRSPAPITIDVELDAVLSTGVVTEVEHELSVQ